MKTKGLTLKEAVESGKPFRRAGWFDFYVQRIIDGDYEKGYRIHDIVDIDDAIADDWEIKVELREFWVNEYGDCASAQLYVLYRSKQEAEKAGKRFPTSYTRTIKLVEVLE